MSPLELVGIPCNTPALEELLSHVYPEHRGNLLEFFRPSRDYAMTFVLLTRYRQTSPEPGTSYTELRFFWKRSDGSSSGNTYYFHSSICNLLKPIAEPKRKLESFIQRKRI